MAAPAPGERARLHGVSRRQEADHVADGVVREGAEAVRAARRPLGFALSPLKRSVEHLAGVQVCAFGRHEVNEH